MGKYNRVVVRKNKSVMISYQCLHCGVDCSTRHCYYKRRKLHFCSKTCSQTYKNQAKLSLPKRGDKRNNLTFLKTVIRYGNKVMFRCRCDCGEQCVVQPNKFGKIDSCIHVGKLNTHYRGHEDISMTHWKSILYRAKVSSLEFLITIEYAWKLFVKQHRKCSLSGVIISLDKHSKEGKTASLDRIDSTKGYIVGNVQWVHKRVNKLKGSMTEAELIYWCDSISKNKVLL